MHRLLARAALAVDGGGRHVVRKACRQPRHPARAGGLLARLGHAAGDDVVDQTRIQLVALDQALEHLRQQFGGMEFGKGRAWLGAAHRAADGVDDDGLLHGVSPEKAERCESWLGY
ncbi:hypothetical protein D9M72_525140 [compost metagenome]